VLDIEIFHIDSSGNKRLLLSALTSNREMVDGSRSVVRQALATDHDALLKSLGSPNGTSFVSEFIHEIDLIDLNGAQSRHTYRVVNGVFGDLSNETSKSITACARQMLAAGEKAIPLAGAAMRLDTAGKERFQGRVFCSLPLPISSPLGSIHVNGFFDLQADRQGLFEDQDAGGTSAIRVNWNRLLLEQCCSEAAARLCAKVSRDAQSEARAPAFRCSSATRTSFGFPVYSRNASNTPPGPFSVPKYYEWPQPLQAGILLSQGRSSSTALALSARYRMA
jgi:hypothetical protein